MAEVQPLKPLVLSPPINPTLITDGAGLDKLKLFFDKMKYQSDPNAFILGWDVETNFCKDFFWRRIRSMQFGNVKEQYMIDLLAFCDGNSQLLEECQGNYGKKALPPGLKRVLEIISPVIEGNEFLKVGVNLGFEYETHRWSFGLRPWHLYGCDMAERVLVAGAHTLKNYAYFSMEEMMERYFNVSIDKTLQQSFNLTDPITQSQLEYGCIDTRLPLGIRNAQYSPGNPGNIIKSDLEETVQLENNAIGAFIDMHIHGERIDRAAWIKRTDGKVEELKAVVSKLDELFIPLVGSKLDVVTDEMVEVSRQEWKKFTVVSDKELELKAAIKKEKDDVKKTCLLTEKLNLERTRLGEKERLKKISSDLGKFRTKQKNLAADCEGNALINYGSPIQLYNTLIKLPGLEKLDSTNDDDLKKYKTIPIISTIQDHRELSKQIDTYGYSWSKEWMVVMGAEEGWLHPGDGRLHCKFNQIEAETGRSSSSQPNAQNLPQDKALRCCFIVDPPDEEEPDGYDMVTADMSGAELRIIAELANAKSWIDAFTRGEDVHSVGTEILYGEKWKNASLSDCAYYALKPNGEYAKKQCQCPLHKEMRNANKRVNFLLAYGGGPPALAEALDITVKAAKALMALHESKFPDIWAYLEKSGKDAQFKKEARDMFGRRRLFPEPTWEKATIKAREDREEQLKLSDGFCKNNIETFILSNGRKPTKEEKWCLTHREPSVHEIGNAFKAMHGSIERQGKNHCIQGTNVSIAKVAMGCGFDKEGIPFLWHTLPKYKAKLLKFVHDELVVQCPKRFSKDVAALIGDAIKRAAALKMHKVIMEFDYNIAGYWKK